MKQKWYLYASALSLICLFGFGFQNCADFGTFQVDYTSLASSDPHADAWLPVDGLEVKDGEWVKIEKSISQKARGSDRNYIASVLYRSFLPMNEALWTQASHKTVKDLIDAYVHANFIDFGGPCYTTHVEVHKNIAGSNVTCNGTSVLQATLQVVPGPNVFRASLKSRVCDLLLQNATALANFKANINSLATTLETSDKIFTAYQLFYLGENPRKRTLASLEELAAKVPAGQDDFKYIGLVLCTSAGWEAP